MGEESGLHPIAQIELGQDRGDMGLDGWHAQEERRRDPGIGQLLVKASLELIAKVPGQRWA